MTATRPLHDRIVLTFDFDLTLAPGSVDAMLDILGVDRDRWWHERVKPLADDGWDEILARGFALIQAAKEAGRPLDRELFIETGRGIRPFDGAMEMFDRLRAAAEDEAEGIELEFVILSSGFANVIVETAIAERFDRVWGSSFHFDDAGIAIFVKRTITHPEKALYLEALAKGLDVAGANAPRGTTAPVDEADRHVLYDQMIYVGDGASDLQAFEFLESRGGIAIAINKDDRFSAADEMHAAQRVENLAPPEFSEGSELLRSLSLAVRSAAARVALRRLGQGE